MPAPRNESTLYLRRISTPVKDQFRAFCVARGWTMAQVAEYLFRECVTEQRILSIPNGKPNPR